MPSLDFFRKFGLYLSEEFLDAELRDQLRSQMLVAPTYKGTIHDGEVDETVRRVKGADVEKGTRKLIHQRFTDLKPLLERHFEVALEGCERPCFFSYGEGYFYHPHRDHATDPASPAAGRTVSVVVFLNDRAAETGPSPFSGGDLAFHGLLQKPGFERCAFSLEPKAGLLVAFRSDTVHEVMPVTAGERMTVVTWFMGRSAASATA